MSNTTSLLVT